MHHIKTQIREIKPSELPTVTDVLTGTTRRANEQELLNRGYVRIGETNYFSSIHQERTDSDGKWNIHEGQERHGKLIAEGTLHERHRKLPPEVRDSLVQSRVQRKVGKKTEVFHVARAEVKSTDVVEADDIHPHSWHGEPVR